MSAKKIATPMPAFLKSFPPAAEAAPPAKSAFTVNYTDHRIGHAPDTKQVVVAAVTLGAAVAYLEANGCVVNSAYSVLDGAQFIEV